MCYIVTNSYNVSGIITYIFFSWHTLLVAAGGRSKYGGRREWQIWTPHMHTHYTLPC